MDTKIQEPLMEPPLEPILESLNMDYVLPRGFPMKKYARPIIGTITVSIQLGKTVRNYEMKKDSLFCVPSFYEILNEDTLTFIKKIYSIVQTLTLQELNEGQLKMRCVPYMLKYREKAWLMTLLLSSLITWKITYDKFMKKILFTSGNFQFENKNNNILSNESKAIPNGMGYI